MKIFAGSQKTINIIYFISIKIYMVLQKNELKKHLDILIDESDKWDDLFMFDRDTFGEIKETTLNEREEIPMTKEEVKEVTVDAKNAFLQTKKWIEEINKKFEGLKVEIEDRSSIEPKTPEVKAKILESYNKNSIIPDIVNMRKYDESMDEQSSREFIQIAWRPLIPKDCFIEASFMDCRLIWKNIGEIIASGEINYFVKKLLGNDEIRLERLDNLDPDNIYIKLKEIVESLASEGFNPNLIFIPINLLVSLRSRLPNEESNLFKKIIRRESYWSLIINDIELRVIHSSKRVIFNDIAILDGDAINWFYKYDNRTNELLWININEYEEDTSQVDVCTRTKVSFDTNHEGVKIIKLNDGNNN